MVKNFHFPLLTFTFDINFKKNMLSRLRVEDWNQNGDHVMIGRRMRIMIMMIMLMVMTMMMVMMMMMMMEGDVETSVEQLLKLKPSAQLPLVNPRKKGKQPRYKVDHDDLIY